MNKSTLLAAMAIFASLAALSSEAYATDDETAGAGGGNVAGQMLPGKAYATSDKLACYMWDSFPSERFKLNVKKHSPLSERREEHNFRHPRQTAYSVHGKQIGTCGFNTMVAITGTVVVANANQLTNHKGAHLGLESHSVRAGDSCRSITVDCTTDEDNAVPNVWTCFSRNDFDVFHGSSKLIKVDETKDERCSFFQNGSFTENAVTTEAVEGPTSGGRPVQ